MASNVLYHDEFDLSVELNMEVVLTVLLPLNLKHNEYRKGDKLKYLHVIQISAIG